MEKKIKRKKQKITGIDKGVEKFAPWSVAGRNVNSIATGENILTIPYKKLNIKLLYNLEIPLLGVYPKRIKYFIAAHNCL